MGAPQEPDNRGEKDYGRLHEEITLLLHPGLVEVEHDHVGTLVGIGDVFHEIGMDRVAAVGTPGVVEIDHIELRRGLVTVAVGEHCLLYTSPSPRDRG